MTNQTNDDEWTEEYDDRFRLKLTRGDEQIVIRKLPGNDDRFETVGYLSDDTYHTVHDRLPAAERQARVLTELADHEITFEPGDHVWVVTSVFEDTVARGQVVRNDDRYQTVEVYFDYDPYDHTSDHQERTVDVDPSEMIHAGADFVESLSFVGMHDVIEVDDFR